MPTKLGKRLSRAEWERLMISYESSGQTQREFCAQHDVAYSSFCYWRKRLHASVTDGSTEVSLIELPALVSDSVSTWRIELDLGSGIILRIR